MGKTPPVDWTAYQLVISDARYDYNYAVKFFDGGRWTHLHFCNTKWGAKRAVKKHWAKLHTQPSTPGTVVSW